MKILDAIEYQNQTRQILSEGYQDLTESQKIYLNRWEKELWPLLEEYNRLAEATLTTDQIQDIFKELNIGREFAQANAIKYVCRYGKKHGKNKMDLFKAIHYITLLLNYDRSEDESK